METGFMGHAARRPDLICDFNFPVEFFFGFFRYFAGGFTFADM